MKILSRGLLAAACTSALLAAPAGAATVTVRVEGADRTLVPTTAVTLPGPAVDKRAEGGTTCASDTAASALEAATAGDWGGRNDPNFGQKVERIKGVTHLIGGGGEYQGRFWTIYLNDASTFGICDIKPQAGDELLLYPKCDSATSECIAGEPLDLKGPLTARPGVPFDVTVTEVQTTFGGPPDFAQQTSKGPAADATVAGGGASATTNADGRATLALSQRGPQTIVATKGQSVREGIEVCVTDGEDGFCGTRTAAGETIQGPTATQQAAAAAGGPDRTAPRSTIIGIREGQTFSRANAPRVLRGLVGEPSGARARAAALRPDPSGVLMVKVRLTRNDRGRCSSYSVRRERLVRTRCGVTRGWYAKVSDRAEWEYQLASRLPRGRYVLDVVAIDKAYNRDDERRRGENRIVFRVR